MDNTCYRYTPYSMLDIMFKEYDDMVDYIIRVENCHGDIDYGADQNTLYSFYDEFFEKREYSESDPIQRIRDAFVDKNALPEENLFNFLNALIKSDEPDKSDESDKPDDNRLNEILYPVTVLYLKNNLTKYLSDIDTTYNKDEYGRTYVNLLNEYAEKYTKENSFYGTELVLASLLLGMNTHVEYFCWILASVFLLQTTLSHTSVTMPLLNSTLSEDITMESIINANTEKRRKLDAEKYEDWKSITEEEQLRIRVYEENHSEGIQVRLKQSLDSTLLIFNNEGELIIYVFEYFQTIYHGYMYDETINLKLPAIIATNYYNNSEHTEGYYLILEKIRPLETKSSDTNLRLFTQDQTNVEEQYSNILTLDTVEPEGEFEVIKF